MTSEELRTITAANGLEITTLQAEQLLNYGELLRGWNAKVNLMSRKDEENVLGKHILHSLALAMPHTIQTPIVQGANTFDIGTGGGFPGIPLAIVRQDLRITMADSIQKKITAVSDMIQQLGLANARAVVGRAEDLSATPDHQRRYDVIVSRAVAPLEDLLRWTARLTRPAARLYALKGGDLTAELAAARKVAKVVSVDSWPIEMKGMNGFSEEGKQIVMVQLK